VRRDPELTVGDFVFIALMALIAVSFSWIGITGFTSHVVLSIILLVVAAAAGYLVVAAAALWLLEWLWPERWARD
jgi:hypothetical protein